MLVEVKVLEEALGVKSVLSNDILETENDFFNNCALFRGSFTASVHSASANIVKDSIDIFLEPLLGEDLVNVVDKVSPADVLALLGGLEA